MKKINAKIGVITILGNCSYLGNLTERGMVMCKFCENGKIIEFDNGETAWHIQNTEKGYEMIYANHENGRLKSITISNCPICGRKLTDEEEKHMQENEEKFTKCDKCEKLEECKKNGKVLNTQFGCDDFEHYILGIGAFCEKEKLNETQILKNYLKKIEKLNDRHQSDCIEINQLQTTIDVLVDKLAKLREVHGL